jgi:hypothetical protein
MSSKEDYKMHRYVLISIVVTITKSNLASCSKSLSRQLQEVALRNGVANSTYLSSVSVNTGY